MKKTKAFTIVELVIVIAVVAILAAVLIPTFAGIIRKAQESADIQLIRNLNVALKADSLNRHATMYSAVKAAEDSGIGESTIKASLSGNEILWDSYNDAFCYYDGSANIKYIPDEGETQRSDVDYFVVKSADDISDKFSTYLLPTTETSVNAIHGLDVGKNGNTLNVSYTSDSADKIIIRTNGGNLTVNAESGTVVHYNAANEVNIIAVAPHSYYEHGTVNSVSIANGHFVASAGADVASFTSTGTSSTVQVSIINGGLIEGFAEATTETYTYDNEGVIDDSVTSIESPSNPSNPGQTEDPGETPAGPVVLGSFSFNQENSDVYTYRTTQLYNGDYSTSKRTGINAFNHQYGYTFDFALNKGYSTEANAVQTDFVNAESLGAVSSVRVKNGNAVFYSWAVSDNKVTVCNLIPSVTYTCEFLDSGNTVLATASLTSSGQVRQFILQPKAEANHMLNLKDLGGWPTTGGGHIKYGLIYRSEKLENASDSDIDFLKNALGINNAIDFRDQNVGSDYTSDIVANHTYPNPLNLTVKYIGSDDYLNDYQNGTYVHMGSSLGAAGAQSQYEGLFKNPNTYGVKVLRYIMTCVQSDCPVLFHCAAGADRTGSIAFLIEALLGVSENDLAHDYELGNRVASEGNFKKMVDELNKVSGSTLQEKAFNWCLDNGFSSTELNAFIAKMTVGGTPTHLRRVTTSTGNYNNSGLKTLIEAGGAYELTITPNENYEISSVTVTMGGVDVTSSVYTASTGNISIANVTGDVDITVSLDGIPVVNPIVTLSLSDKTLNNFRINDTGGVTGQTGYRVIGALDYVAGRTYHFENFSIKTKISSDTDTASGIEKGYTGFLVTRTSHGNGSALQEDPNFASGSFKQVSGNNMNGSKLSGDAYANYTYSQQFINGFGTVVFGYTTDGNNILTSLTIISAPSDCTTLYLFGYVPSGQTPTISYQDP